MRTHRDSRAGAMMRAADSMKRKMGRRTERLGGGGLLIAFAAAIFVLILLLRMMVFVVGRGHRHF